MSEPLRIELLPPQEWPEEPHGPFKGSKQIGPTSLQRALSEAIEAPYTGIRIAVSAPHRDYIAIRQNDGVTEICKCSQATGHSGALSDTGEWTTREHSMWVPANV